MARRPRRRNRNVRRRRRNGLLDTINDDMFDRMKQKINNYNALITDKPEYRALTKRTLLYPKTIGDAFINKKDEITKLAELIEKFRKKKSEYSDDKNKETIGKILTHLAKITTSGVSNKALRALGINTSLDYWKRQFSIYGSREQRKRERFDKLLMYI